MKYGAPMKAPRIFFGDRAYDWKESRSFIL